MHVNCTQNCRCYLNCEWRHGFLHSKALCRPIAKSIYTEQNYYNTATQHENSKSSDSELLFELLYFFVSVKTILVQFLDFLHITHGIAFNNLRLVGVPFLWGPCSAEHAEHA